jgi:hypothetical protein
MLGIPTSILAPKGWKFRDVSGTDISNEQQFKARFTTQTSNVTPIEPSTIETTIEYTPIGKQRQTYTIKGNQVFNKAGQEVFKEDSVDRNKIFANLALKQGRAVLVEHKGAKYIVNNKNQIISGTTGKMMQWDENNGDRKAIVALAQEKFPSQKKQDDDDVTDNNIFNC